MLVVLSCNLRGDIDFMFRILRLSRSETIRIDDTRRFDLKLDRSVQSKVEVKAVLVVCDGTDGRNDQLSISCDVRSHVSEVGVFVQDTGIFLTDKLARCPRSRTGQLTGCRLHS